MSQQDEIDFIRAELKRLTEIVGLYRIVVNSEDSCEIDIALMNLANLGENGTKKLPAEAPADAGA